MNHNANFNDPVVRQTQLEKCREELQMYELYSRARQQYGYPIDHPQFNQYGQIVNLPPNLRRVHLPPTVTPPSNHYYSQNAQQAPYQPDSANSFSLCYSLSDDQNSPARQFFDRFQHHPMLPKNMTPKRIIFVYERPDVPKAPPSQNVVHHVFHYNPQSEPRGPSNDAAVGDFSIVRKNVDTQTEWKEVEQKRAADKQATLHNTIMPSVKKTPTSNLSEPGMQELNTAFMKVAKWLQMCQKTQNAPVDAPITVHQQHMINQGRLATQPIQTTQFHGSPSSGDLKKQADVPSTIVRHSSKDDELNTERASDVVEGGDDNEMDVDVVKRDSEKLPEGLADEKSSSPVAEKCSESNEVPADINAGESHERVDESQKESTIEEVKIKPEVVDLTE